ncbi:MAG TPA: response regulator [Desulfosarcina sp.]|nr:response regulator [Desulfosarcina sp.]
MIDCTKMAHATAMRRVLLADDEERFVQQTRRLLERRGFQVDAAADGRQALALIDSRSFDAVVLDLRMPEMDGLATLKRVREKAPSLPVIMLTGHASLESGVEAIRQGAFDYLMKPCSIEDLGAKLDLACTIGKIRRRPILWPRTIAGELILDAFRRIEATDSLLEAFSLLNYRLTRMAGETLFIVDEVDHLAGHLTKQDIVDSAVRFKGMPTITWTELSSNPQWLPDWTIAQVMATDTAAVDPTTPLEQVADIMITKGVRTLPVVDDRRRVLGVIRLKDVLVYLDIAEDAAAEPSEQ